MGQSPKTGLYSPPPGRPGGATLWPMNMPSALSRLLVALPLVYLSVTAHAKWQWIDGSGRKVFSDTAPPPGIPDKNILRRPAAPVAQPAQTPAAPPPAVGATSGVPSAAPRSEGVDPRLEARKREADAAEAARKKSEEDKMARQRAENCERARTAKAALDSGVPLTRFTAAGERTTIDDATRAAEMRRAENIIRSDCNATQ